MRKTKGLRAALNALLCLCLVLSCLLVTARAAGETVTVDGLKYTLNADNTATLTGYETIPDGGAVSIPGTITYDSANYAVTAIGESAFRGCSTLTAAAIPEGVTEIKGAAFMGCSGLTSVTLPSSVTSIGRNAFDSCAFASIDIPAGVTRLEGSTFSNCDALTSLTIPDSVTYIDMYAIYDCDSLASIRLPANVKLYMYAIYNCNSLRTLTIPAGLQLESYYQIGSCSNLETLIFADGATELPFELVAGCPNIKNIVVPRSVETISAYLSAFTDISSAVIHYRGTAEEWDEITIKHTSMDPVLNTSDPHFIVSENKPSTCAEQGYENKLLCSTEGCGYVYAGGATLPLAEHTPVITEDGNMLRQKCEVCTQELGTLTVAASGGTYNGEEYSATLTKTGALENVQAEIVYAEGSETLTEAPVKAGDYAASVTYEGKTATVQFSITQKELTPTAVCAGKVYDGTTAAAVTVQQYGGILSNDDVEVRAAGVFQDANAGENKTVAITYTLSGADSGNYKVSPGTASASITPAPMTVTAKDQTVSYGTTVSADAYTVSGLVTGHSAAVTLTPSTAVVTQNGTVTPSVKVTAADGADVTANYQITAVPGKLVITLDTAAVDTASLETVNYGDQEAIEAVLDDITQLLSSDELTEEEKAELAETQQKAEALLERIEDSLAALQTDAVEATLGVTPENVKISQNAEIQEAIRVIEAALATYGGNYSQSDKQELQDQIDILKASLEAIAKMEAAQETTVPETTVPESTAPETTVPQTTPTTKPASPAPNTGDNSNGLLWSMLMLVSMAAAALLIVRRKTAR